MASKAAELRRDQLHQIGTVPLAPVSYLASKRMLDVVVSIALLVVCLPLMLAIAVAILLESGWPVIFRQHRVLGEWDPNGRGRPQDHIFTLFKFRTMRRHADDRAHRAFMTSLISGDAAAENHAGASLFKMVDDPRITRVGKLLRASSLDELPQLWNVLCGEMSLVGPRPAIPYEVEEYSQWHMQRLAVKQGLTGLWQVSGRSERTFDEMVMLDIEYVRRRSLGLDLGILLATLPAITRGHGV